MRGGGDIPKGLGPGLRRDDTKNPRNPRSNYKEGDTIKSLRYCICPHYLVFTIFYLLPHMISRYNYKGITWVDLDSPTREEVLSMSDEFGLPILVIEEIVRPSIRSRVDVYPNILYLILHFPVIRDKTCEAINHSCDIDQIELNFIIGKKFLITSRYDKINPLKNFAKAFEKNAVDDKGRISEHAGFLFFEMARELYQHSLRELDHLDDTLAVIEDNIFNGKEEDMVVLISETNRHLLDFKKAIRFHGEVLKSFESAGAVFFGYEFSYYLGAVTGEYNQLNHVLESNRDILNDLHDTNDSLLTKKINGTMQTLTLITVITIPLSILPSLFSMGANNTPLLQQPQSFWLLSGLMIAITLLIVLVFIQKRWIRIGKSEYYDKSRR